MQPLKTGGSFNNHDRNALEERLTFEYLILRKPQYQNAAEYTTLSRVAASVQEERAHSVEIL